MHKLRNIFTVKNQVLTNQEKSLYEAIKHNHKNLSIRKITV